MNKNVANKQVCATCGVEAGSSASGRWLHLDEIPEGYGLHDVEVMVSLDDHEAKVDERGALREGLSDLLRHHDALCPPRICPFALEARRLLGRPA